MGEPADSQGSSAHELTPIGSHPSMFPCPPVHKCLPEDPAISRNLRPCIPQVPLLHPASQLPSYAPMETGVQMPQDPTSNLSLQIHPSPLMYPGIPVQSRLQNNLSSVCQLSFQMPQSPLFPPGTPMQSNLQWHSYPERSLGPQVSPGPSMTPSIPMHLDPPTLETLSVCPRDQMPSSSSVNSGPMVPSNNHGDQQVHREVTRIQRKERTMYSKEQKLLLQKHFEQDMYPSLEKRVELARMIGVTESEIQVWFKNQRAKCKQKNPEKTGKGLIVSNRSSKDVSGSTHSHCHLSVVASDNAESMSPGTSTVASISKLNPRLEASLHDHQAIEDAGCSPQEDPVEAVAPDPGQPTVTEAQPDPAMAEGPVSVETPVSTIAGASDPGQPTVNEAQPDPAMAEGPVSVENPVPTTAGAPDPGQPTVNEAQPDPAMAEGPVSVETPVSTIAGASDPGQPTQPDPAMAEGPVSVETPVPTIAGAPDPGQFTVVEVQPDPAMAEEPVSVEVPVPTTAAVRGPDDTQCLYPSSEQLWQWIHEDLNTWEDS